jgi:REP element-mobilizing transposase RayT
LRLFGGSLLTSNPKVARPLSKKEAIHLVLKSDRATGSRSMLNKENARRIDFIIRSHAKQAGIRIYHLVNVGNHLHIVIKLRDIKLFASFIKSISGIIARHVLKKERGPADKILESKGKASNFWIARPFTRIIAWGKDYNNLRRYMEKNRNDAKAEMTAWGFDITDKESICKLNTG